MPETPPALRFDSALLASKQHERQRALADADEGLRLTRTLYATTICARAALGDYGNVQLAAGDIAARDDGVGGAAQLARAAFRRRRTSTSPKSHADLSRAYRRAGRSSDAERHIRAALAIDAAVLPAGSLAPLDAI